MKFTAPHWLTAIAGTIATICGALIASNSFPQYQTYIGLALMACTALAVPTITKSPVIPVTVVEVTK